MSDIHGNLEALEAVLADASTCGVPTIYCLGDMIGYGPDPIPCVQLAMNWSVVLQGHFEHDAMSEYVLLTPDQIAFRRVEYDIDRTIHKLRHKGDDDFYRQRLKEGR